MADENIGCMDEDEGIGPKDTQDLYAEQSSVAKRSWEQVKRQGAEYVGSLLMKNMFSL